MNNNIDKIIGDYKYGFKNIDNGVDKNLSSSASIDNITSSIVFNYDSADDKNYAQSNTIIGRDNRNA